MSAVCLDPTLDNKEAFVSGFKMHARLSIDAKIKVIRYDITHNLKHEKFFLIYKQVKES